MADFVKLAVTAKRLINANGRTVTLNQLGNTPADSAKPWRGVSTPVRNSVTGKACFVSRSDLGYVVSNVDNLKRSEKVALFAANDDEDKTLEEFDEILDGSVTWRIDRTEVLNPADTRLMYMFEVSR